MLTFRYTIFKLFWSPITVQNCRKIFSLLVVPFGNIHHVHHAIDFWSIWNSRAYLTVDTMGPINPPALGGYTYVTRFVDQLTKWKEIFLIKSKTHTIDSLVLFNKAVVIPSGERLIRLRGDVGTEFTSEEFRRYCLDIGVKLDCSSMNTPRDALYRALFAC